MTTEYSCVWRAYICNVCNFEELDHCAMHIAHCTCTLHMHIAHCTLSTMQCVTGSLLRAVDIVHFSPVCNLKRLFPSVQLEKTFPQCATWKDFSPVCNLKWLFPSVQQLEVCNLQCHTVSVQLEVTFLQCACFSVTLAVCSLQCASWKPAYEASTGAHEYSSVTVSSYLLLIPYNHTIENFKYTNTQIHKYTNTQTHKHTNTQTHKQTHEYPLATVF